MNISPHSCQAKKQIINDASNESRSINVNCSTDGDGNGVKHGCPINFENYGTSLISN